MELRFPNIKNIEDYKKLRSYGNIPKQLLLLLYNVKLWYMYYGKKKLWYYGKNYGTMEKNMLLYICTENNGNLTYYGKNYGTIPKTMEI